MHIPEGGITLGKWEFRPPENKFGKEGGSQMFSSMRIYLKKFALALSLLALLGVASCGAHAGGHVGGVGGEIGGDVGK